MSGETTASGNFKSTRPSSLQLKIGRNRTFIIAFVIVSLLLAVIFPFLDLKFQMVLALLPITLVVVIAVLLNPYIGIFLFFLFEYGRLDFFFPAIRPLRVAIILEVVTLLSWIFHLIKGRKNIIWPKFNWIYVAFIGVIASTVITAWNNRNAYDIFEAMSIYFMIYLISTNVVSSFKRFERLIWLLFLIHTFFAVKGIIAGGKGGGAFMGDENDFALAMNMMIPFAFFMFLGARNKIKKFSIFLILVALTLAVISSMSRGGWVGLMATVIFCVIKSRRVFVSLFIMIVLSGAIISFAPHKYWDEVQTITDTHEATAASRINYWKAALRMFLDYPITGVGAGNGGIRMPQYYRGPGDIVTRWGAAFHGTLPHILAELGSLGMLFYLLMLYMAFKYLNSISRKTRGDPYNKKGIMANAIMVSIISYLTTATFLSTPYYPQLWTLYTLTMILVILSSSNDRGDARVNTLAAYEHKRPETTIQGDSG